MPIPDEKARAWTRPEDYWPPRRPARVSRAAANRRHRFQASGPLESPRASLSAIPFTLLMVGLSVLLIAVLVTAWPGRRLPPPENQAPVAEVGTAPRGWMPAT